MKLEFKRLFCSVSWASCLASVPVSVQRFLPQICLSSETRSGLFTGHFGFLCSPCYNSILQIRWVWVCETGPPCIALDALELTDVCLLWLGLKAWAISHS